METWLYPSLLLAALGFGLSLFAHGAAWLGIRLPDGILTLTGGLVVAWIPAIVAAHSITRNVSRHVYWTVALLGCPNWLKYTVYGLVGYAVLTSTFLATAVPAAASAENVVFISTLRLYSGYWLPLYLAAAAFMVAALRRKQLGLKVQFQCAKGHVFPPTSRQCKVCGQRPVNYQVVP